MRRQECMRWTAAAALLVMLVAGLGVTALGQAEQVRTLTVELDRPLYYHDEVLRGRVGALLPAERIRIDHLDVFGRVIDRLETRKGRTRTVPFTLRLSEPFTVLHRIVVTGEKGAHGEARFLLAPSKNTWDRYHLIWTGRLRPEASEGLATLRTAGVTGAVARTPEEVDAATTQDLRLLLAFGAHGAEPVRGPAFLGAAAEKVAQEYAQQKDPLTLVRLPCLDNAQERERWTSTLLETVSTYGPRGPLGYSLGGRFWVTDPERPLDVCFSPATLSALRGWLAERYDSVRALNAEWEVKFGGWPQVVPMTAAEVVARERAKGEGGRLSLAPWVMHRRFMDERLADVAGGLWNAAQRQDETARVGFGGFAGANAYGGYDASRLPGVVGWLARREGPASSALANGFNQKLLQSRRAPVPVVVEVPLEAGAPWRLWDSLLSGDRGALLTGAPDISDQQAVKQALTAIHPVVSEINAGLGAVFGRDDCVPKTVRIALVYSQPSIEVLWMLDALALGQDWSQAAGVENSTWQRNFVAWLELLEDVGLHPVLITPDEIGRPAFEDARYAAVILPKTVALADEQAQALRGYVQGGGFLVADSQCGLFDEHGRQRETALLDDLFGVQRSDLRSGDARGRFTPLLSEKAVEQPAPDRLAVLALNLERSGFRPVEPSIRKQGAAPLVTFGETAALLARPPAPGSRSRGSTLYLNTTLLDYPQARTQGKGEALRQLVRNLLRVVDLKPQVRVVEEGTGRDLPLVGKRLFQHNGLMYLALLYPYGSEVPATPAEQKIEIRLLEQPYIYDMRTGEFRARTEVLRATLKPYEPLIYSLLPYKLDEVVVEGRVRGRDLTYDISLVRREQGSPTEDHVVRLELDGPDGLTRSAYTAVLVVPSGRLTARTRIGLEEPAGGWTIRVVDVITGLKAEADFVLE